MVVRKPLGSRLLTRIASVFHKVPGTGAQEEPLIQDIPKENFTEPGSELQGLAPPKRHKD